MFVYSLCCLLFFGLNSFLARAGLKPSWIGNKSPFGLNSCSSFFFHIYGVFVIITVIKIVVELLLLFHPPVSMSNCFYSRFSHL